MGKQRITAHTRAYATELSAEIAQRYGPGKNSTGNDRERAFRDGLIGELEFARLLTARGIPHEHHPEVHGPDSRGDVMVWCRGRPVWIDVKTAVGYGARKMMVPEHDFARSTADVFLGARILGDSIEFRGWLTRAEMSRRPVTMFKVLTRWEWLHRLRQVDDLLGWLDVKVAA